MLFRSIVSFGGEKVNLSQELSLSIKNLKKRERLVKVRHARLKNEVGLMHLKSNFQPFPIHTYSLYPLEVPHLNEKRP